MSTGRKKLIFPSLSRSPANIGHLFLLPSVLGNSIQSASAGGGSIVLLNGRAVEPWDALCVGEVMTPDVMVEGSFSGAKHSTVGTSKKLGIGILGNNYIDS